MMEGEGRRETVWCVGIILREELGTLYGPCATDRLCGYHPEGGIGYTVRTVCYWQTVWVSSWGRNWVQCTDRVLLTDCVGIILREELGTLYGPCATDRLCGYHPEWGTGYTVRTVCYWQTVWVSSWVRNWVHSTDRVLLTDCVGIILREELSTLYGPCPTVEEEGAV